MNPNDPTCSFSTDRPLQSKDGDVLNRAPFAERIASVLRAVPPGESLTIGIHGPWGDGKTTVLNILRATLESGNNTAVVNFNPWRFADEPSMIAGFFESIAEPLDVKLQTNLQAFAAKITAPTRLAGLISDKATIAADILDKAATSSLEQQRKRLSEGLVGNPKCIVVLVDDIDRLDKHETQILFRLIKACMDLPNVSYVLAFDDVAVAKALGERYGGGDEASGRAFLEKIIQVPLKLPVAFKEDLRSMCFRHVEGALQAAGVTLSQDSIDQFVFEFEQGVLARVSTPRAAKQYGNALMFALPTLKDECNPVDLMLVEAVRVFYPALYEVLRVSHADFIGTEPVPYGETTKISRGPRALKVILDAMPEAEATAAKHLIGHLFPRVHGFFFKHLSIVGSASDANKNCRISSPLHCHRYFAYTVPSTDVAEAEVNSMLSLAKVGNANALVDRLARLLDSNRARRLIEKLRGQETEIDAATATTLSLALAKSAHHIPVSRRPMLGDDLLTQTAILISHLLRRVPAGNARVTDAKAVVASTNDPWFGGMCLRWMHLSKPDHPHDNDTLTQSEANEVREVLVNRTKALASEHKVLFDPDVPELRWTLHEWSTTEGREPVERYLLGVFRRDPSSILRFLESIAGRGWVAGSSTHFVADIDVGTLKRAEEIVDLDHLDSLVRQHCQGDLARPQWKPSDGRPLEVRLPEQFVACLRRYREQSSVPLNDGMPEQLSSVS